MSIFGTVELARSAKLQFSFSFCWFFRCCHYTCSEQCKTRRGSESEPCILGLWRSDLAWTWLWVCTLFLFYVHNIGQALNAASTKGESYAEKEIIPVLYPASIGWGHFCIELNTLKQRWHHLMCSHTQLHDSSEVHCCCIVAYASSFSKLAQFLISCAKHSVELA